MCSGNGAPGNNTRSSGNNARRLTVSFYSNQPLDMGWQLDPNQFDFAYNQGSMMELQGKVVVITGASMGIGEEIARLFAREGAKLVLCSRDLARVEAARER